jgi:hypothetical protein
VTGGGGAMDQAKVVAFDRAFMCNRLARCRGSASPCATSPPPRDSLRAHHPGVLAGGQDNFGHVERITVLTGDSIDEGVVAQERLAQWIV